MPDLIFIKQEKVRTRKTERKLKMKKIEYAILLKAQELLLKKLEELLNEIEFPWKPLRYIFKLKNINKQIISCMNEENIEIKEIDDYLNKINEKINNKMVERNHMDENTLEFMGNIESYARNKEEKKQLLKTVEKSLKKSLELQKTIRVDMSINKAIIALKDNLMSGK